jgi:hypothetical protein
MAVSPRFADKIKWCGAAAAKILPSLLLQVPIKGRIATREVGAVVVVAKRSNHPVRWKSRRWHLEASNAFVSSRRLLQSLAGWTWSQKSLYENFAISATQREHGMLTDGSSSNFVRAAHDELCQ